MSSDFRPPPALDLHSKGNLAETFRRWKQSYTIYVTAAGLLTKPKAQRKAILLNLAGEAAVELSNNFVFSEGEDKEDPATLLQKFEDFCIPKKNEVFERHKFWSVDVSAFDTIDLAVSELRTQARGCNFGTGEDDLIRDKIVFSIRDQRIKERLLREADLSLTRCLDLIRAAEKSREQIMKMDSTPQVNLVRPGKSAAHPGKPPQTGSNHSKVAMRVCLFCCSRHILKKEMCPAYGKLCKSCGERNHFAKSSRCALKGRKVQCISHDDDAAAAAWIGAVSEKGQSLLTATLKIADQSVRFQLDSGAEVNLLPQRYVDAAQIQPTTTRLRMWNGSLHRPVGKVNCSISNPATGEVHDAEFVVVDDSMSPLLGVKSIQSMNLITVNTANIVQSVQTVPVCVSEHSEVFEGKPGKIATVHLYVDENVPCRAVPPRKIPLAMQGKVKTELDRLCKMGILEKIEEPTQWMSQMAVATKRSGELRICIDPQALNRALVRERYMLPTFEDVLPSLSGAQVFSKLDVADAFWHLELDDESSLLTAMGTPFGRYVWRRLPFGLSVSSELFQRSLHQALEGLPGLICVADDIVVTGRDQSEHDANLSALLQRCAERGVRLNIKKCAFYADSFTFLGHVISANGVCADPEKKSAVINMPVPQDVHELRRFCGMTQYLSKFLPQLSEVQAPLRELTQKDMQWTWSSTHQEAFEKVKRMVCDAPVLAHYQPKLPLSVQVDASQHALGAALMQEGKPVAYASRTLSGAEQRYAQVEKECLAMVYGLERFDQFTFGRQVTVISDHKPLEVIVRKPLCSAPKRLQAMILRLLRYDYSVVYAPGHQLLLADTLSRAPDSHQPVHDSRFVTVNALLHLPVSDGKLQEIREATASDPELVAVLKAIREGWPDKSVLHSSTSEMMTLYNVRDTLSVENGIILKGERIVIPRAMRKSVKASLHAGHLGFDSMMRRARDLIFWPGLTAEVKQLADSCDTCRRHASQPQREPLMQHSKGNRPWQKVGVDLFTCAGRCYLITVDYWSNFFEIDYLPTYTAVTVIHKLKAHFARYGIPEQIMSDNGPPFSSEPFREFCRSWGVQCITSSPGYSQSNGMAESAVKAAKRLLQKTADTGEDAYLALLEVRNTPRQGVSASPAQLLLGRQTRSLLPVRPGHLQPEWSTDESRRLIQHQQRRQKTSYDRRARDLPALCGDDRVLFRPTGGTDRSWREGTVVTEHSPRSYVVRDRFGNDWRRNRRDLRAAADVPSRLPADSAPGAADPDPAATRVADTAEPRVATTAAPPVSAAAAPSAAAATQRAAAVTEPTAAAVEPRPTPPVPPRRSLRVTNPPERLQYFKAGGM